MKNVLRIIKTGYIFVLTLLYSMTVYAAQSSIQAKFDNPIPNAGGTIPKFIAKILEIAVQIGTPIAVLAIIYSGFLFLVAQGNQEKLKTAKRALAWSLVGAFVLLGAQVFSTAIGGTVSQLHNT